MQIPFAYVGLLRTEILSLATFSVPFLSIPVAILPSSAGNSQGKLINGIDLAVIFRAALRYPLVAQIMRSPTAPFPGRTLTNQNQLLARYPGTLGGKTGFTNLARKTYVGAAERDGRRLVVVQMYGTGDLYGQAIGLLDWGFAQLRQAV